MSGHSGPILKIIALEPTKMELMQHEKIPDKAKVITASLDNTILLWDLEKMDVLSRMEAPKNSELTCITFLLKCCLVASGHEDGAIRLWNMEINSSVLLKCQDPAKRHTNTISCITSTRWKGSEYLICGSYDGKISIWEISEKAAQGEDNIGSSTITPQLRTVIDNKKITQAYNDKLNLPDNLKMADKYEKIRGNEILVICCYEIDHEESEKSECFIIVGGNSVKIQVYSIKTGQIVKEMEGHTDSVTCMVRDEFLLITGSDDGTIRQWDLTSFTHKGIVGDHGKQAIQSLTLLPNSGLLLSCAQDN